MKPVVVSLTVAAALFSAILGVLLYLQSRGDRGGAGGGGAEESAVEAGAVDPLRGAEGEAGSESARSGGSGREGAADEGNGGAGASRGGPAPAPGGADEEGAEDDAAAGAGKPPLPEGTAVLTVEVVDRASAPRAGLTVEILYGQAAAEEVTSEEGLAVFPSLAAGKYSFRARGDDIPALESAKDITLRDGEEKQVTLTVESFTGEIAGRVLARDGTRVPGIRVFARKELFAAKEGDFMVSSHANLSTVTGPEGEYRFTGLEPADYTLHTEATPEYPSVRAIYRAGVQSADLILDPARDLRIYGVVHSSEGEPIANATVVPVGQSSRQVRSDAEGRYDLALGLSDERTAYALKVQREGYKEKQVNILAAELEGAEHWEVNVVLEPLDRTAPVSGVIADEAGEPVAGETVMLYSAERSGRYSATSNGQGHFTLGEVQVGEYRLWIYPKRAFKDYTLDPVEVREEGLELEIRLESVETGVIRGRMVDPAGAAVPRFTLQLRSMTALGNSLDVVGDDGGRFEVEDVPAGSLLFETRSFPRLSVRGITLEPGDGERDLTLVLDWGEHSFSGSVVDEGGAPVPGARVQLSWDAKAAGLRSSSIRHTVTDAAGRFTFSELAPVEHAISVSVSGYAPGEAIHRVGEDGSEPTIKLKLR